MARLMSLNQRCARFGQYIQARTSGRFSSVVRRLARWIPDGSVCMDVGANHGKFAKELARVHGGRCPVWCFEPMPYNYSLLRRVVGGMRSVRIFEMGLSDAAGDVTLYIPVKRTGRIVHGSAHLGDPANTEYFGVSNSERVDPVTIHVERLDDLVEREHPARIGFMKIDVEGAEQKVLLGASRVLAEHRPAIYCELIAEYPKRHGFEVADTVGLMADAGYTPHLLDAETGSISPVDPCARMKGDYLFLHESEKK